MTSRSMQHEVKPSAALTSRPAPRTQPKCVAYGTNDIFSLYVIHMWYCHVAQIKKAPYDIKCTLHGI